MSDTHPPRPDRGRTPEPSSDATRQASDAAWLESVQKAYGPAPMTPAERHAFDARLESRIEAESMRGFLGLRIGGLQLWQPAGALVVVAVAAWWMTGSLFVPAEPTAPARVTVQIPASLDAWEREVLSAGDSGAPFTRPGSGPALPDDYRAIAGLFLGASAEDANNGR